MGAPADSSETLAGDPYAGAKANLREVVKWLATSFAAVGAVMLAGTSLSGLSGIGGAWLATALACGMVGLVCVVAIVAIMLGLLTSRSFFFTDIATKSEYAGLKQLLDAHAADLISPLYASVDALYAAHRGSAKALRDMYGKAGQEDKYAEEIAKFASLETEVSRVTNFAEFEVMRANLWRQSFWLFLLVFVAFGFFSAFAVLTTMGKADKDAGTAPLAVLTPTSDWDAMTKALAAACGSAGNEKVQVLSIPRPGWFEIRILDPGACAGLRLTVPTNLIAAPDAAALRAAMPGGK